MELDLIGKHVLISGGSRGIGRALALAFAHAGARVLACHRDPSPQADRLAAELKEAPGEHLLVQADVTDPTQVDRLLGQARERFGGLDVVVHNAGVISHVPFAELEPEEWHRILDTSLTAAYLLVRGALPLLGPGASVIAVGSRAARAGIPLRAHYTAAKAGLEGLTRSLAKELGPRGIRVNVIAPGVIDSDDTKALPAERRAELTARYSAMTALGRLGRPDEIAGAALFLASGLSSYLTGQTICVDGGI
ncbi:SDR family NAD(P)-dependent oxidoreductase [Streptomyces sp. SAJ15]|uniref:SDR family NAD(P)-dependent oxidoreductase n=1 Tax=Streptomyces sp. SAJ15 TaxID=2011095 RepID=UPI00118708C2|nr:SDR family NAD(P)-dependent oxidoreductase [Streptomyces sp. SAJ15]TVL88171.1 short-chain dehydrogenase [Streptomyces sp. SAJ15]